MAVWRLARKMPPQPAPATTQPRKNNTRLGGVVHADETRRQSPRIAEPVPARTTRCADQVIVAVCATAPLPKATKTTSPVKAGDVWPKESISSVPARPAINPNTAKPTNAPVSAARNDDRPWLGALNRWGWYGGRGRTGARPSTDTSTAASPTPTAIANTT